MRRTCLLLTVCCLLLAPALAQFKDLKPTHPAYPAAIARKCRAGPVNDRDIR